MGLDYQVHVGPYLRILNPPKPITRVRRRCPNVQCKKHQEDIWGEQEQFCPKCGSRIEEVTVPAQAPIYFDFREETNEELRTILNDFSEEGYVFVVSDLEEGPGESFDPTESRCSLENITVERMQSEMREFEQKFSRHIQKLKRVFGESAVELEWGVLSDMW